jgi:hypothetical protein
MEKTEKESVEMIKDYYFTQVCKGIILNYKELTQYAKKHKLRINKNKLRKIRRNWNFLAMFSRTKKTPQTHFASLAIMRPGINQIDLGFFPHLSGANKGFIGFLLCVEMVAERINVIPIKVG